MSTYNLNGKEFPIVGHARVMDGAKCVGFIPIVDVPMVSDYKWQLDCLNDRLEHPEKYADKEDLPATIARLRKWLSEHSEKKPQEKFQSAWEFSKAYEIKEACNA